MKTWLRCFLVLVATSCAVPATAAQEAGGETTESVGETRIRFGDPVELGWEAPFFEGATYDPAIPTVESVLGQRHGTRLSHHAEIVRCFELWAEASPRVVLERHGTTHEGRELVHAVVTSPANHGRLDEILADLGQLADPRGVSDAEAERIVTQGPAAAWMGYSIHGDELSGCDAALALGYHLTASTDEAVAALLDDVVVVIDPILNPDGRERIIGMVEQAAGYTPNLDYASMHRGRWPYGRGNHYLFDMNRDWMAGTQPETRGRWRAALRFHPQLFVDAHEMWSLDTFLFYPQAPPINRNVPERHLHWQRLFGEGAARAFDRHGWSYYTREWADGWAPFYSDAWGSLSGATGILYEQARTLGSSLRRASGEVLTYRESVHHQAVASLANLETLAAHREERLRDYLADKRRAVDPDGPGNDRMVVVRGDHHPERVAALAGALSGQGVEVFVADEAFEARDARGTLGDSADELEVPAGSLVVPVAQPMRAMVRSYLEHDPRLDAEALLEEREDLEREGETNMYDLTSWSLAHAFDLDAWWCAADGAQRPRWSPPAPAAATASPDAYAWAVDGGDDASVRFAAAALERGVAVHVSDEPLTVGGRALPRGSLVVRRDENRKLEDLPLVLTEAARAAGVALLSVETGISPDEGPDLGGGHFHLLSRPRIALLSNAPVAPDVYGHLWHELDRVLGVPFTILDAQLLSGADLRRYNVIVLPPSWGGLSALLEPVSEALGAWVEGGGTLVACGNAAAALTAEELGLSSVVLRRHALEDLADYAEVARREREALAIAIDEASVWGDSAPDEAEDAAEEEKEEEEEEAEPDAPDEDDDRWMRTFSPQGATVRGRVDDRHWITVGCGPELPVLVSGSHVFLTRPPVRTPVRLAEAERLRLAGLVWPEARERLAESAWLAVERKGNGQVILFAHVPGYRGFHRASARLFANAVVYGPGLGASQPIGW